MSKLAQVGEFSKLKVLRKTEFGFYLESSDENGILIPGRYAPEDLTIGDHIIVFVYRDSEDRVIATTLKPYGSIGDVRYLKVVSVNNIGAFLDWGLPKDLMVPYKEQDVRMIEGKSYLVMIYKDKKTDRMLASSRLKKFIKNDIIPLHEKKKVEIIVAQKTDLGFKVIVENKYWGMVYNNEIFQELFIGKKIFGFIKKIRSDKKIDITLQAEGYSSIEASAAVIVKKLKQENGKLPYSDQSEAVSIKKEFSMSKKSFKKALGYLYKARIIELGENSIRLIEH
ncbi:S1 RNA-binding domain-containing protein [Elusimicrobiota bacterium]